jgi:hypothetical protein
MADALGSTRAFGAVPGPSGSNEPVGSTRAFGAVAETPGAAANVGSTRAFGAVPGGAEPVGSTKAFGAVPDPLAFPAGSSSGGSPGAPANRAAPRSFEDISPSGESLDLPWSAGSSPDSGSRPKLVPDGHGDLPWATSAPTASVSLPDEEAPFARTEPSKPAASQPGDSLLGDGLDRPSSTRRPSGTLPPELLGAARSEPAVIEHGAGQPSALTRVLIVLAVISGIVLAGYLAYPAFRDRNSAMPADAVSKKEAAVAGLRKDDAVSRQQSIAALEALSATHPKYAEVQAELAVALTLQLGDLYAESDRLRLRLEQIKRQYNTVTNNKETPDWPNRASALRADQRAVESELQPLQTGINESLKPLEALMERVRAAPEVEPAASVAARLKAQALFAATTGAPNALALAERLRQTELTPSWSVVARAEYALRTGSPSSTLEAVGKELEALHAQDPHFRRVSVLSARVALRQGDTAAARRILDEVVALNAGHELARRLLAQLPADDATP